MKTLTKNQVETLNELYNYSHVFFTSKGAEKFLTPFGIEAKDLEYTEKCEGGKGLTGNKGEKELRGVSAFSIPSAIMQKLGIKNNCSYLGRGTQFRAEIDEIIYQLAKY